MLSFLSAATNITTIQVSGHISYAVDALSFFEQLKSSDKYPNPNKTSFTTQEAVLVRNYCNDENLKLSTRNNRIGAVRRFLQWCEENNVFAFKATFFDYLRQYEEPSKTSGHSIPDSDLAKLSRYLHENASIYHFNVTTFRDCLHTACKDLGFSRNYNASNLRDTHMTKALEHIIRNGKSDLEMGLLTKHKHLDTTKNHYIEMELEKMLEATYGITIGSAKIDAAAKIVDKLPSSVEPAENDVEYGCGKCTADVCTMKSSLPCMVCEYFITTIDHASFFIRAIENTDRLMSTAKNRHDIEDLVIIKNLYGAYLEAIYKIKEAIA